MAKSTQKQDLQKILKDSQTQRQRLLSAWAKIEGLFGQIPKATGEKKTSLLKELQTEMAAFKALKRTAIGNKNNLKEKRESL